MVSSSSRGVPDHVRVTLIHLLDGAVQANKIHAIDRRGHDARVLLRGEVTLTLGPAVLGDVVDVQGEQPPALRGDQARVDLDVAATALGHPMALADVAAGQSLCARRRTGQHGGFVTREVGDVARAQVVQRIAIEAGRSGVRIHERAGLGIDDDDDGQRVGEQRLGQDSIPARPGG
jgi:hypothetical protein